MKRVSTVPCLLPKVIWHSYYVFFNVLLQVPIIIWRVDFESLLYMLIIQKINLIWWWSIIFHTSGNVYVATYFGHLVMAVCFSIHKPSNNPTCWFMLALFPISIYLQAFIPPAIPRFYYVCIKLWNGMLVFIKGTNIHTNVNVKR